MLRGSTLWMLSRLKYGRGSTILLVSRILLMLIITEMRLWRGSPLVLLVQEIWWRRHPLPLTLPLVKGVCRLASKHFRTSRIRPIDTLLRLWRMWWVMLSWPTMYMLLLWRGRIRRSHTMMSRHVWAMTTMDAGSLTVVHGLMLLTELLWRYSWRIGVARLRRWRPIY